MKTCTGTCHLPHAEIQYDEVTLGYECPACALAQELQDLKNKEPEPLPEIHLAIDIMMDEYDKPQLEILVPWGLNEAQEAMVRQTNIIVQGPTKEDGARMADWRSVDKKYMAQLRKEARV